MKKQTFFHLTLKKRYATNNVNKKLANYPLSLKTHFGPLSKIHIYTRYVEKSL